MTSPAIRLRFRLHVFRIFSVLYLFPALLNTRARRSQRTKFLISSFPYKLEGKWAAQFKSIIQQSLAKLLGHQTSSRLSLSVPKMQNATFPTLIRGSGRYDPGQVSQVLFSGIVVKTLQEKKNTPKRIEWNLSEAYLLKGQLRFSGFLSLNGNAPFPSFCLQTLHSCGIYRRWRPSKIMAYNFLFHAFLSVLLCCFADNSRWELTTRHLWIIESL